MYTETAVPVPLQKYVRRILVADVPDDIDITSDVRATGYMYLGFVFRGTAQAVIADRLEMAVDAENTAVHVSGQVVAKDIAIHYQGALGHVLVELSGLGHFELLGIFGEDVVDRCQPPGTLNPELDQSFSASAGFRKGLSGEAAVQALVDMLLSQAREPNVVPEMLRQGLAEIENNVGQVNLSTLCDDLGVSQRHFSRQFAKYVGQSPKRFCRILQLNRALQAMIDKDADYLAGIASDAGFSDQSHFNRAFRQHLMTNPLDFLNSDQMILRTFLAERLAS